MKADDYPASHLDLARPTPLAVVRDGRLSFGARGLYLYLSNLPVGMTPSMASCESPEGATRLATLLKELRSVGAIRYEPIRGLDGRLGGTTMIIVPAEEWAVDAMRPSVDDTDDTYRSCRP